MGKTIFFHAITNQDGLFIQLFLCSLFDLYPFPCSDDCAEPPLKWHVYVTGHSLGGALATLLALELSSSQLAR